MSAPITEAHCDLRRQVIFSAPDEGAQLIADSEAEAVQTAMIREYGNLSATNESLAKERDRLRAEVELDEQLQAVTENSLKIVIAERDQLRAEVERLKTQRDNLLKPMREQAIARAELAEAELAAERARLDWLEDHGWVTGEPCGRAAIDAAMKEGAK